MESKFASDEIVEATPKIDGSLGIMFLWRGDIHVFTRKRANSEQAVWATAWAREHMGREALEEGWTYLVEIVSDDNTVCIDYPFEGLVLLSATSPEGEAHISCPRDCVETDVRTSLVSSAAVSWKLAHAPPHPAPPPSAGWSQTSVPGYIYGWNYTNSWLRANVSSSLSSASLPHAALHFNGVKYDSHVYVNGEHVGGHQGGYDAFELDVTAAAAKWAPGRPWTLDLSVRDWTSLFASPYVFGEYRDSENLRSKPTGRIVGAIGGYFYQYGVWDACELRLRPRVHVSDVFVTTSVRRGTLAARVEVRNADSAAAQGLSVELLVHDAASGSLLTSVAAVAVPAVAAGATATAELSASWVGPLWWPYDPRLLYATAVLYRSGSRVHESTVRFGFREMWTEGPLFYLNGLPMHIRATATWPALKWPARDDVTRTLTDVKNGNMVGIRFHTQPWQEVWYDVADEVGLLVVEECAYFCDGGGSYAYNNTSFWDNWRTHITAMIRRDRNHPSVYMYSLENEIWSCHAMSRFPQLEQSLADLAAHARTVDPSRLITFESDWDPKGSADVIGLHYPHEYPTFTDYPNTAEWIASPNWKIRADAGVLYWNRTKPLYIGEYLHVFGNTIDLYTPALGEQAYSLGYYGARNAAKAKLFRWQTEAYRYTGVSGIDAEHPLMRGLADSDFAYWRQDNYLAHSGVEDTAAVRGLLVGYSGTSQVFLVAEQELGCTRVVLCQLSLMEKLDVEPMAEEFATDGGRVVVHGLDQSCFESLASALGVAGCWTMRSIDSSSPPHKDLSDPLLRGLSNRDLYWELFSNSDIVPRLPMQNVSTALFHWLPSFDGVEAGMFEVADSLGNYSAIATSLGSGSKQVSIAFTNDMVVPETKEDRNFGTVVFDNINWDSAGAPFSRASAYFTTLLRNLDAHMPYSPRVTVYPGRMPVPYGSLAYSDGSLLMYANTALVLNMTSEVPQQVNITVIARGYSFSEVCIRQ
eukprot:m51a1_g12306 hypothetical protein (981) ;mRNA; r:361151-367167